MNDEQYSPALGTWLKDSDVAPPDPQTSARRIMTGLPERERRRSWWPFHRQTTSVAPPTTDQTAQFQPTPISATNGHTPTASGRTQSMFSPAKAIVAGALAFAFGGVLLIAQPFEEQGGSVPGAATDEVGQEPALVSGTFVADQAASSQHYEEESSARGILRQRGSLDVGRMEMSDARLSGDMNATFDADRFGSPFEIETESGDFADLKWGTVSIVNDEGTWEGTRVQTSGRADLQEMTYYELVGAGGYEGLSAILFELSHPERNSLNGIVFPGELPPDR